MITLTQDSDHHIYNKLYSDRYDSYFDATLATTTKKTLIMCSFILFQTYQKPASSSSSDSDIVYLPRLLLLKSSTFEQLQRNNSDIESLKALTVSLTHQYVTIQINFISRNWKFDNLINIEFRPNIERAARKMHDSSKVR